MAAEVLPTDRINPRRICSRCSRCSRCYREPTTHAASGACRAGKLRLRLLIHGCQRRPGGQLEHVWESRVLVCTTLAAYRSVAFVRGCCAHLALFRRRDNKTEQAVVKGLRRGRGLGTEDAAMAEHTRVEHESNMRRTRRDLNLASQPAVSLRALGERQPRRSTLWSGGVVHTRQKALGTFHHAHSDLSQQVCHGKSVRKRAKRLALQKLSSGGE